jgi:hypothetical protein
VNPIFADVVEEAPPIESFTNHAGLPIPPCDRDGNSVTL